MNPLQARGSIAANDELCNNIWMMKISNRKIAAGVQPGQFVHLAVPGFQLRRPFTIADANSRSLSVVYKVAGRGTAAMTALKTSMEIDVLGPLGRGFEPPSPTSALLVGGGMGVAALVLLARRLERCTLVTAAATAEQLWADCLDLPPTVELVVATDDGSSGFAGTAVDVAREYVKADTWVAACGPSGMLRGMQQLLQQHNIPGQFALEERMACGLGACMGCVCQRRDGSQALVCSDGPVFDAREVEL